MSQNNLIVSDLEQLKQKYQNIHFIGIGGIGMSAIAHILLANGLKLQGSDPGMNDNVKKLAAAGVRVFSEQVGENIKNVDLVVKSSAIKDDNPEIIAAKAQNIQIAKRSDILAVIMASKKSISIAGTHGKTSITAMVGAMLEAGDLDPTIVNGGIMNAYNSNAKIGQGEYLVAESDESDGTFVDLPTYIGVISNIEPEHLDFYGDFAGVIKYFERFIEQIPQGGAAILCQDDPEVQKIIKKFSGSKNIITYGYSSQADIVVQNIQQDKDGLTCDIILNQQNKQILGAKIPMFGKHNAQNAMICVAIAQKLGFSEEIIRTGLKNCLGVQRRFTKVGELNGVSIIDDYGHHPNEIRAVVQTAKSLLKEGQKLITIFQPHRYTRTHDLFDDFCASLLGADIAVISDIYAAGQAPIEGVTQDALIAKTKELGHKNVIKLESPTNLPQIIQENTNPGDIAIFQGAGTVSLWARELGRVLDS